jgi:hypothetical protein
VGAHMTLITVSTSRGVCYLLFLRGYVRLMIDWTRLEVLVSYNPFQEIFTLA